MLTRAQMIDIINGGGSVIFNNKNYRSIQDLPSQPEIEAINSIAAANLSGKRQRFTHFVGDVNNTFVVTTGRTPLPLVPNTARTVEGGLGNWFDSSTSRVHSEVPGQLFTVRLVVRVAPAQPTQLPFIICEIDVSAAGDGSKILDAEKNALLSSEIDIFSFSFDFYSRQNFIENGGLITLRSVGGDVQVTDPRLFIKEG